MCPRCAPASPPVGQTNGRDRTIGRSALLAALATTSDLSTPFGPRRSRVIAVGLGGCHVNAHWICGVRGPVVFFLTCIGTAFAVQECRADENTHIDFRTARGGVTSRSAGRYVTERSPVGR
jgi:hypothetical protein